MLRGELGLGMEAREQFGSCCSPPREMIETWIEVMV